jgi:hypothetical protein
MVAKKKNKRKLVKRKTTFSIKSYWAPTPKKTRKIGDALLGVFSITSMSTMIMDYKPMAVASLIIGVVGKILTNFFSEEPVFIEEGERETQMD